MFLLFEDEFGTVNLIVGKAVYERHRHLARAEPLLLARGRLERSQGVVNVIVRELARARALPVRRRRGAGGPGCPRARSPPAGPRAPGGAGGRGLEERRRAGRAEWRGWLEHARRGAAGAELRDGTAQVSLRRRREGREGCDAARFTPARFEPAHGRVP